ncbi:hypothetical protein [Halomonas elongata]|nr:hypothetical protein [Halomonas elongata]MBW5800646.1 hypothetical protein [Halomonas elongata]
MEPKTKQDRRDEIDRAASEHSRIIDIDRWHEQKRLEQELQEVWDEPA